LAFAISAKTQKMRDHILKKTVEDDEQSKIAFRTYFNYIDAFRLVIPTLDAMTTEQRNLCSFRNLPKRSSADIESMRRCFHRGWLTYKALTRTHVENSPGLAQIASLCAPVQSYYAIRDFAAAAIESLGAKESYAHASLLNQATDLLARRLLSHPFDQVCWSDSSSFVDLSDLVAHVDVDRARSVNGSVELQIRNLNQYVPLLL
jgi:hypothetical protein